MSEIKLRIDSVLKDQLKQEAKRRNQSLNNLIEVLLTEHMDKVHDPEKIGDCRMKKILDPCCGSRMFHFDRTNPNVVFGGYSYRRARFM